MNFGQQGNVKLGNVQPSHMRFVVILALVRLSYTVIMAATSENTPLYFAEGIYNLPVFEVSHRTRFGCRDERGSHKDIGLKVLAKSLD